MMATGETVATMMCDPAHKTPTDGQAACEQFSSAGTRIGRFARRVSACACAACPGPPAQRARRGNSCAAICRGSTAWRRRGRSPPRRNGLLAALTVRPPRIPPAMRRWPHRRGDRGAAPAATPGGPSRTSPTARRPTSSLSPALRPITGGWSAPSARKRDERRSAPAAARRRARGRARSGGGVLGIGLGGRCLGPGSG
jgi:hypothetical protein